MRHLLTGIAVTLLLLLNTLVLFGPLMVFALLKLVFQSEMRDRCSWAVMWIAETWSEINKLIFRLCLPTQWEVRGDEGLRNDTSYMVVSNHQSWVDIPALVQSLNRRTPFFKFFLKKELIWVPFLGLAWWALDYPFMKRYTKAFLAKNPELKGKDLEITKEACELYKRQPVTVVNYLEGTRFTPAKHAEQASPYQYLLKPKGRRRGLRSGGDGRAARRRAGRHGGLPERAHSRFLGPDFRPGAPGDHRHPNPRTRPRAVAGRLRKRPGVSRVRAGLGESAVG